MPWHAVEDVTDVSAGRFMVVWMLCIYFFSFGFFFSCHNCIIHCEPCHISLWQPSTDKLWRPRDPDGNILSLLKNTAQILISFRDLRWASSAAHFCAGQIPYSPTSNQWSKGSTSRPIQEYHWFSTPPREISPLISALLYHPEIHGSHCHHFFFIIIQHFKLLITPQSSVSSLKSCLIWM
jgi:hypothetical protein